ncbi:response regulator [Bacteriovorax sp. Seq25_V]|uniref:response regulator n=1 Tax=Bacteriovorax sp. Seq25_V TaxID=1201288 RepID=UPI000389E9DC|nr:response regulator [Bacteriovorax sp. Seq25_V]EQC47597.1 response regulator receiver domain protein [Bacteriovorax sp. Seq25_V]
MKEKSKPKIMIVDSKASRRDSLASRFRLQGYYTDLSNSGFQALSQLEKDPEYKSLIVLGNSSDMSAAELIGLTREFRKKDILQILFVDKKADQEDVLEMFKIGANDYIVYSDKVFGTLLDKVEKFGLPG